MTKNVGRIIRDAINAKPIETKITVPICWNGTKEDVVKIPNPAMVVNALPNKDPPVVLSVVLMASTGSMPEAIVSLNLFVTWITNGTPIPIAKPERVDVTGFSGISSKYIPI